MIKDLVIAPLVNRACKIWALTEIARHPELYNAYCKSQSLDSLSAGLLLKLAQNEHCSSEWFCLEEEIKALMPSSAFVYFIETCAGDRVKIGRTKNLHSRFNDINNASGGDCRMVLALVTPDVGKSVDLENLLHRTFPGKRIGGEWFKAKDEGGSFVADYVNYLESVFKEEIH